MSAGQEKAIVAVDLFCGVGGKTHGLIQAGIPVVAGVDTDATCEYAYRRNNTPAQFYCRSVEDLDARDLASWYPAGAVRVLIGCAPCQPFSTYSYRYGRTGGSCDVRWGLLGSFGRLVAEVLPEVVTAENVPELQSQRHSVYNDFVELLVERGYSVSQQIVRCADYGVPQTRERLVLLASRLGRIDLVPPTHTPDTYVTVRDAIGTLPAVTAGGEPPKHDRFHRSSRLSELNAKRIAVTPPGGSWRDWPEELQLECHKRESGKTYPSVYGRMAWDELGPTVTTQCFGLGNGRFGHPEQNRAISLREAALLQTFPPSYEFVAPGEAVRFSHVGRHIGNAVPVALSRAIGRSIVEHVRSIGTQVPSSGRRSGTARNSQLPLAGIAR